VKQLSIAYARTKKTVVIQMPRYILLCIYHLKEREVKKTKVFKSGNSIAVRIPKEFGLKEGEVWIKKEGEKIVIIPIEDKWNRIFRELEEVKETKDFLEPRNQPEIQERDLF